MAIKPNVVNKIPCAILIMALFVAVFLFLTGNSRANEAFTLTPIDDPSQIRLLPVQAWPPPEADQGQTLLKFYYLRGVVDALQYTQIDPDAPKRTLKRLKGMDLNELAARVDAYYLTHPENSGLPPASVLLKILSAEKMKK